MPSHSHLTSPSRQNPHHTLRPQTLKHRHPLYPFSRTHTIYSHTPHHPTPMSTLTPASFIDDGTSFTKRHVANWLASSASESSSAYTGSYIDDGADMRPARRNTPGFGPLDAKFYKARKPRANDENGGVWNEDIGRAVGGDMRASLERLRGVAGVEVKRAGGETGHRRCEKKDTITIQVPRRWGAFVIKCENGRVVVVDGEGEFDSGVPDLVHKGKWVRAPTTISAPPSTTRTSSRKYKTLTPITESKYEDGSTGVGENEDLDSASPTGFFMTGGKEGWPARSEISVHSPKISRRSSPLKSRSPVRSPPGSWPSPPQSLKKSSVVSGSSTSVGGRDEEKSASRKVNSSSSRHEGEDGVWDWYEKKSHRSTPTRMSISRSSQHKGIDAIQNWNDKKSHRSNSSRNSRSSRHVADNMSTKSYSTYKPATVEDTRDTSSDIASIAQDGAWGGSKKSSRQSGEDAWTDSQPASDYHEAPSTIVQNWIGDKVKTISEASSSRRSHRSRSHAPNTYTSPSRCRAPSEASWDGYEIPKTQSEVSVVGTGSARTESRVSRRHGSRRSSTHGGRRTSHHGSPSAWDGGSEQWGGSQRANVDGWAGDETASETTGYANGYDEDNSTYLNGNWEGVSVRVGRRTDGEGGRENLGAWE